MAQIINIAGAQAIDDPEYRYKMPRIIGKVEGRGNGIKTAIPNMVDVASSLHRPPGEVTKFFGCELGAQTTYNDDTERSIVNGAHETRVLQDKLSVYIEKFVLCPACKLPETSYKIKHEIIYHNCLACGAREPCDMQVSDSVWNFYSTWSRRWRRRDAASPRGGSATAFVPHSTSSRPTS